MTAHRSVLAALGAALGIAIAAPAAFAEDEMKPAPAPAPVAPAESPAGDMRNSRFFDTHDANLDGKVTKDEYTGDATVFELFDVDKDGVIVPSEVGLPATYKPTPMPKPMDEQAGRGKGGGGAFAKRLEEFKRNLAEWDTDKDGKVTKDEFKGKAPFEVLDFNKDGVLTMDDLRRPGGAGAPMTPEQAARRFKDGDKNGDGKITKDEFPGEAARFDAMDRNKDGGITQDELEASLKDGAGDPGKNAKRMFLRFDRNGDGKVSREEFPGGDEKFKELDKDGDGLVEGDELPAVLSEDLKKLGKAAKAGAPAGKPGATPPAEPMAPAPDASAPTTPPATGLPSLFAALDKDRDGRLSRAEFSGSDDDWRRLDKDANGWVTPDEAR